MLKYLYLIIVKEKNPTKNKVVRIIKYDRPSYII